VTAEEALDALAAAGLDGWRGLPPLTLADVRERFPDVAEGVGHGRLGAGAHDYVLVSADGYEEPLRVWLDGERVVAIDVEYPPPEAVPSDLGAPAERRDFHWAGLELAGGEHVYPDRGLALFVNPDTGGVLRLEVFAAGSLADYDAAARLHLVPRRRRA
jgi:hypothetical protein